MLETPHVAVGIAIATKFPNPWVSIPLALASHFILDKVPHWNPHTYTETQRLGRPSQKTVTLTIIDIIFSLGLGFGAANSVLPNIPLALTIITCSLASVLPDVSKYPFFLFKKTRKGFYKKWVLFERSMQVETKSPFWGLLTQVFVILASYIWII
ncbi:MAG: hypothetical protein AAB535_03150 [Patescibacteria group bacterium]